METFVSVDVFILSSSVQLFVSVDVLLFFCYQPVDQIAWIVISMLPPPRPHAKTTIAVQRVTRERTQDFAQVCIIVTVLLIKLYSSHDHFMSLR